MNTPTTTACQIVLDVLLLRGPTNDGGPFRMVTADPVCFMTPERLAMAQRFSSMVPPGTTVADVRGLAERIAAHLPATPPAGHHD